jgi:hypothetical protein
MRIAWTAGGAGINPWQLLLEKKERTRTCSKEDGSTDGLEKKELLAGLQDVEGLLHCY